ncbi:MAG: acetyl-CoA carboxylase carboxyltransferase subunit alpha [Zetaproteobacteria bacterium]|nr:acetyl-CoA carboxylase carboxyltransferase subunit alpha [Zetaproteobacteria bacterium]
MDFIPLEKPLVELEMKIAELKNTSATQAIDNSSEISKLEKSLKDKLHDIFDNLTPYQMVQVSRHPRRPNTLELIQYVADSFIECHGDRNFFDDPAIVGGLAQIDGAGYVILGHQKGRGTKENIHRNFGMPRPEGYRKALRLMSLAERMGLPIITFIDTPGAYPGVGAEERGQSEAIGKNIMVMSRLKVPILSFVVGEGGSGGALALGVANVICMLQNSTYSVISPEGCASILFKDSKHADKAANALKLTAQHAQSLGIADQVIPEPLGGAHRDPALLGKVIRDTIKAEVKKLKKLTPHELESHRQEKFLKIGKYTEKGSSSHKKAPKNQSK